MQNAPDKNNLYHGYERWKGWDEPFSFSPDDADYYAGECREARIKGADVLEVGFGQGGFLAWAGRQGARLSGTEINDKLCQLAGAQGVELLPVELTDIAADHAGRFDTIVAFDVFEHMQLDEIGDSLRACDTMLKAGGHLIMRFPNGQSPFGLAPQHGDPTHKTALSLAKLEPLLQRTGFKVVRYGAAYSAPGRGGGKRLVRALRKILRKGLSTVFNFAYAQATVWDPVVTLVLCKSPPAKRTAAEKE